MTRRVGTFLASVAVVALFFGVAASAKPSKTFTRPCELTGDAFGEGEVGVKAWSYGPLTMTVQDGGLQSLFVGGGFSPDGVYVGPGRVSETRLDLYFDLPESDCRPATSDDPPGPGTGVCQYRLILLNGVYYRNEDKVEFGAGTEALLIDNWLTDPVIAEGTANLTVQFLADGGGDPEPEPEPERVCKDGQDNDGDGLFDCDDPDCANKKWCQ